MRVAAAEPVVAAAAATRPIGVGKAAVEKIASVVSVGTGAASAVNLAAAGASAAVATMVEVAGMRVRMLNAPRIHMGMRGWSEFSSGQANDGCGDHVRGGSVHGGYKD